MFASAAVVTKSTTDGADDSKYECGQSSIKNIASRNLIILHTMPSTKNGENESLISIDLHSSSSLSSFFVYPELPEHNQGVEEAYLIGDLTPTSPKDRIEINDAFSHLQKMPVIKKEKDKKHISCHIFAFVRLCLISTFHQCKSSVFQ